MAGRHKNGLRWRGKRGWKFKIGLRWRRFGGEESAEMERERRKRVEKVEKEWSEMEERRRDGGLRLD
jgi:hypothetical protein